MEGWWTSWLLSNKKIPILVKLYHFYFILFWCLTQINNKIVTYYGDFALKEVQIRRDVNRLYSPWPENRILFICPAKTHNYRLRATFWSFCDGAPDKLCQIKESLSLLNWQDKINPTCVSFWVFHIHDKTTSGVFIGCMFLCTYKCKFSRRFSWFYLFIFPELYPGISSFLVTLYTFTYLVTHLLSWFPLSH